MGHDDLFRWHHPAQVYAHGTACPTPQQDEATCGFQTILCADDPASAIGQLGKRLTAGVPFCLSDAPVFLRMLPEKGQFCTLTGGSTGAPKVILRRQASWIASFRTNETLFSLTLADRVAVLGGLSHSLTLYGLLEGLHLGLDVHLLHGMSPARQRAQLSGQDITVLYATPTQLRHLARGAEGTTRLPLRLILCGGGALDPATRNQIARLCPAADLRVFYGAAETSFVALSGPDTPEGSVGKAYPGVDIRIDQGGVWARSPYLFDGYAAEPDHPAQQTDDGFVSVGECGKRDDQGNLFLLGRADRAVTIADQTVHPETVEAMANRILNGRACVALPVPDALRGHALVLVVDGDASPADVDTIRALCRATLGAHATPRRVMSHPHLPTLPSGKPDLVTLRHWLEAQA